MLKVEARRYPFEPLPPADKKQVESKPTEESETSESQVFPFEQLPAEIKVRVLTFLDLTDLGSCCLTSRELNQLVAEDQIWQVIAMRISCPLSKGLGVPYYKQVVDFIGRIKKTIAVDCHPKNIPYNLKGPSIDQFNAIQNWCRARNVYYEYCKLFKEISRNFPELKYEGPVRLTI